MEYKYECVGRSGGRPAAGAQITVRKASDGSLATIYAEDGVTEQANPITTDRNGCYGFKAADGDYDVTIAGSGIETKTFRATLSSNGASLAGSGGASLVGYGAGTVADALEELLGTVGTPATSSGVINELYSRRTSCSYADILDAAKTDVDGQMLFLKEISATRFEIYMPCVRTGRYQTWRLDADEANFDGATGYTRPYIITTIGDYTIDAYRYVTTAEGTLTGTWLASGSNQYSATTGNKATFTVSGVNKIDLRYGRNTNAGIAYVKLNGAAVAGLPTDGGGNSYVDMYGASGTVAVTLATGLDEDASHTVEVTVSGTKNASSTDYRVYLSTAGALGVTGGLSVTSAGEFTYPTSATVTTHGYWKEAVSAVDYAVLYRPSAVPSAAATWAGSVHGYENRQSMTIYVDGEATDLMALGTYTRTWAGRKIRVLMTTSIEHPEGAGDYAEVTIDHLWSADGYSQSTKWTWLQNVYVTNGYSQMFSAHGGLLGGVAGDYKGWCNRVTMTGVDTYDVSAGQSGEFGHKMTPEVVFWGTPKAASGEANRDADAGDRVVVVSLPDLARSMNYLANPQAATDGCWVQDRATLKKLYVQHYRSAGEVAAGAGFSGKMRVKAYNIPSAYALVQ